LESLEGFNEQLPVQGRRAVAEGCGDGEMSKELEVVGDMARQLMAERDEWKNKAEEYKKLALDYDEHATRLEKERDEWKARCERAAELLRSVVGDLLDERAIDWTEWQLSAQRWLRDAGFEK
jgi:hypothetical protein